MGALKTDQFRQSFDGNFNFLRILAGVVVVISLQACSFGSAGHRASPGSGTAKPRNSSTSRYVVFKNGGELSWPIAFGRLASAFGPRDSSFHDGLDLSSEEGIPVRAAHSGKVIYSGNKLSGYGNLIIIRDKSGLLTIYAHNARNFVDVGQSVKRGSVIGTLGATGHATGPHVHFEVRVKDKLGRYVAVDPLPLLSSAGGKPRFRVNESLTPIFAQLFGSSKSE